MDMQDAAVRDALVEDLQRKAKGSFYKGFNIGLFCCVVAFALHVLYSSMVVVPHFKDVFAQLGMKKLPLLTEWAIDGRWLIALATLGVALASLHIAWHYGERRWALLMNAGAAFALLFLTWIMLLLPFLSVMRKLTSG